MGDGSLAWQSNHRLVTRVYFTIFYTTPMLMGIAFYCLIATPFWLGMKLKNRLSLNRVLT